MLCYNSQYQKEVLLMNKEYTYLDGKVIVEDENGKKRVTEYSDKLDEILVQENLIEVMENKLSEVDKKIQNNDERLKRKKNSKTNPHQLNPIVDSFPTPPLIDTLNSVYHYSFYILLLKGIYKKI